MANALERVGIYSAADTIPVMAAALAYRTIFSMLPLLGIGLLVLRLFGDSEKVMKWAITNIINLTGLEQVIATSDSGSFQLDAWLQESVKKVGTISFTGIGIVSAGALIYAAMGLLIEVEKSFNTVYGARRGRTWTSRITQYWLAISLGPLLVCASFLVGERASSIASSIASETGGAIAPVLISLSGYMVSVAISGSLLSVLYLTVPNTRVYLRPALTGGIAAGIFLELAKYGFGHFVSGAGYKSLYGTLALLPLFMLWIYVTWAIVLLGLRVSYLTQHRGSPLQHLTAHLGGSTPGLAADPAASLTVIMLIARRFIAGKGPISADELTRRSGLDAPFVQKTLELAEERGLVVHVTTAVGGSTTEYTLRQPADRIAAADVLKIGYALTRAPLSPDDVTLIADLRQAQLSAFASKSLADLLAAAPSTGAAAVPATA